ncbi:transcriptional regulator, TetR family [Lacrimispora sphenoides]|uniref:TetR/AcrR family transcriptional regulator n=1 Tax=Lacrimispora sphenoides TaxID=29370 RepID=UPI0008C8A1A4|nr:TetR family transcriptional regulator [Lacrimispora sphenoides]SET60669.1 transcriptional regulator, TetR family [Lacrimispora sphenoides]
MPTERFYNLPAGKRKTIRDAAVEEFTRVPFEKASINKIIQAAGISRGSFYTYFEDKRDVLRYIFEDAAENFQNSWVDCAEKNNGNLWKTAETFLQYSISNTKENVLQLIKNIADSETMFGATHQLCQENSKSQQELQEMMYRAIDTSDFKDQSMETFGKLVSMIFLELAHCMGWYYHHREDEEKIKKIFLEKLEILQYGIRKQSLQS